MSRLVQMVGAILVVLLLSAGGSAQTPITLTFMTPLTGADGVYMDALVEAFNRDHPHIQVTHLVVNGGVEYNTKVATGIASGSAPEILYIRKFDMGRFLEYFHTFTPDELRETYGIDVKDIYPSLMDGLILDGAVYGIPNDAWIYMFSYNRAHFQEAGLDPDNPPATGEEFVAAAQQLTSIANPAEGRWPIFVYPDAWDWLNWLYQLGGDLLTPDGRQAAFNTEAGVEALRFIVDLVHTYQVAPMEPGDAVLAFRNGDISMRIFGVWDINAFAEALGDDYGVAPVPQIGPEPAVFSGTHVLALPAVMVEDPATLDAAMTFVKYAYEHQLDWVAAGQTPSRISVAESADFAEQLPHQYRVAQQLSYVKSPPYLPVLAEVLDEVTMYLEAAFYGEISPEEAIEEAAWAVDDILADYWATVR